MPTYLTDSRGRIDDSRSVLEKLRRRELEAILSAEAIPAPRDVPAIVAREILRTRNVDVRAYIAPDGRFLWPERNPKQPLLPVDSMSIPMLRKHCTHLGIGWSRTERKAELVERIKEKQNGHVA